MRDSLHLGLVQMTSVDDVGVNLKYVEESFRKAADQGAELVVLPENSLFMRLRSDQSVVGITLNGPEIERLQNLVESSSRSALMLTTPQASPSGRAKNSTWLLRRGQSPAVVYDKIHLFDVDVAGAPPVRESDHFESGLQPQVLDYEGWKIGLSICYDLRFAELYRHYAQAVDLILVPSAFLVPTGQAHWHVLLRARAIEAQAFLAAPAQNGEHISAQGNKRYTYGHSLVVDPWGAVLADLENSNGVQVVELRRSEIEKVRTQIPMKLHRRLKPF